MLLKDVVLEENAPKTLLFDKHKAFLQNFADKCDEFEYAMTEHFRMSGMYWVLTALDLANALDRTSSEKEKVLEFIRSCYDPSTGGYRPAVEHDPHILYTLSALQILAIYDELGSIDTEGVVKYIAGLQLPDGSFQGDCWGEVDTRFSFCAVASLAILKRLDAIDADKAADYIMTCENWDGGFGVRTGSETHSGQIYCCVGTLSILGQLHRVKADLLGWWLCERQLPSGGLNGRPEKLPDVCYSWWVLASLTMLGRLRWIDSRKMRRYILACQDDETGGIADRPGDMPDPFHTLFGLAGLSLIAHDESRVSAEGSGGDAGMAQNEEEKELADDRAKLAAVDPVFCMPRKVIEKLGISTQILTIGVDT